MISYLNVHWEGWCWSWNYSTLATWCEELTHWKKTLMPGKIESKRRGWQRMRWLDGISYSMDMSLKLMSPGAGDGQGGLACCSPRGRKEWGRTEWLKWTELNSFMKGLLKQYLFLHLMIFKYAMCKDVGFFSALFLSGWGKSNWS